MKTACLVTYAPRRLPYQRHRLCHCGLIAACVWRIAYILWRCTKARRDCRYASNTFSQLDSWCTKRGNFIFSCCTHCKLRCSKKCKMRFAEHNAGNLRSPQANSGSIAFDFVCNVAQKDLNRAIVLALQCLHYIAQASCPLYKKTRKKTAPPHFLFFISCNNTRKLFNFSLDKFTTLYSTM